jgi:hypothetical protein
VKLPDFATTWSEPVVLPFHELSVPVPTTPSGTGTAFVVTAWTGDGACGAAAVQPASPTTAATARIRSGIGRT